MSVPTSAAEAEAQAERIRLELSGTIDQLKDNLHPSRLAGEAFSTTRAHTPDWIADYLSFIASPAGLALVGAATASVVTTMFARNKRRRTRSTAAPIGDRSRTSAGIDRTFDL